MTLAVPNGMSLNLPAHSILSDFERAKAEIIANPRAAQIWVPKLLQIPNGFYDFCSKTIDLAKSKVGEWLDAYMFKNSQIKKGYEIANWLGNFNEHKTHGRPINYQLAIDKGLKITLLEDDQKLQDKVLSVYHATIVTFDVTPCVKLIENHLGKGSYVVLKQIIHARTQ